MPPRNLPTGSSQLSLAHEPNEFTEMMVFLECIDAAAESRLVAERFMAERKCDAARHRFMMGLRELVGRDVEVPLSAEGGGVHSEAYMILRGFERAVVEAMACCSGVGSVLKIQGKLEEALMWFEEVRFIHKNMFLSQNTNYFDWILSDPNDKEYWKCRIVSMVSSAEIFLRLGNTGMATHYTWTANNHVASITDGPSLDMRRYLEALLPNDVRKMKIITYKHPDPKLSASLGVKEPALQAMGSWEKVWIPKQAKIQSRYGFASFVWNGRFYVCGGEKSAEDGPYFRDLQHIDLESLDGWHALPPCPAPAGDPASHLTGHHICVHDDKAYRFSGSRVLDVFDLREETWSRVKTRWEDNAAWPFPTNDLANFGAVYTNGKLYVFGGTHSECAVGCDMWMVLNLRAGIWRRLSGCAGPGLKPDFEKPGPRKMPLMWVDGREERIWMMYGEADRWQALLRQQELGAKVGYVYDDFWSWDINAETWTRQRIVGNAPCPRSEAAVVYNPALDRTFVFSGTNVVNPSTMVLDAKQPTPGAGSYYADTFMLEPTPKNAPGVHSVWRQVLTRGFPTYRAQAHLVVDPKTGRMYMFGGYNTRNPLTVLDAAGDQKSFGDLWMLRVEGSREWTWRKRRGRRGRGRG